MKKLYISHGVILCINMLLVQYGYAQTAPENVAKQASWIDKIGRFFGKNPAPAPVAASVAPPCDKPVYLTLDTGHMETAAAIADVLNKHQVKASFFVSNEKTRDGKDAMSWDWGQRFWALRGKEGHEFASRTWDDVRFSNDVQGVEPRFVVQVGSGAFAGRSFTWDSAKYCAQITQARERIEDFVGKKALPLWRAPGGKASAKLLAVAQACGYQHVAWSPAGAIENVSLAASLKNIQQGDVLWARLGSSQAAGWETTTLEPLIVGLKERGLCFATLRDHPAYKPWIDANTK